MTRYRLKPSVPLESAVQHMVRRALEWHPDVAWVSRINSGAAWLPAKDGKKRPVKFHDIEGCSDLVGQMKASRGGAFLAVEIKRPGWKGPADDRERQQAEFLAMVRKNGGVAGFMRSPEEAIALVQGE